MPLYMKHSATVLSLNQLLDEAIAADQHEGTAPAPAAAAGVACQALPPDAYVHQIAGACVAKYAFAVRNPRSSQLQRRSTSDALVPSFDDASSVGSRSPSPAAGDSDDSAVDLVMQPPRSHHHEPDVEGPDVALQKSLLDNVLLALWEDCTEQGLFRYDVTECATKLIPGHYGFVAQLNEGRASKKRPTEFRIDQVCQPFDDTKFNFKKAFMREVLFQFEPLGGDGSSGGSGDAVSEVIDASPANSSPNLVLINVSPIEYGHVLLCPKVLDCLPQLVDTSTMLLALRFAMESDNPYCRIGYNSLGAYATINHLHFQAYYLAAPFPCERAPCALVKGLKRKRSNVRITRLVNYPVNGYVIEVGDSVEEMAAVVGQACQALQKHDVPHNLLITDSGSRVFLWPQCYAEKQAQGLVPEDILDTGVNPAVFEIAGHLVLKRAQDYEEMTQDFAWRMLAEVSYPEERFAELAHICFG